MELEEILSDPKKVWAETKRIFMQLKGKSDSYQVVHFGGHGFIAATHKIARDSNGHFRERVYLVRKEMVFQSPGLFWNGKRRWQEKDFYFLAVRANSPDPKESMEKSYEEACRDLGISLPLFFHLKEAEVHTEYEAERQEARVLDPPLVVRFICVEGNAIDDIPASVETRKKLTEEDQDWLSDICRETKKLTPVKIEEFILSHDRDFITVPENMKAGSSNRQELP